MRKRQTDAYEAVPFLVKNALGLLPDQVRNPIPIQLLLLRGILVIASHIHSILRLGNIFPGEGCLPGILERKYLPNRLLGRRCVPPGGSATIWRYNPESRPHRQVRVDWIKILYKPREDRVT